MIRHFTLLTISLLCVFTAIGQTQSTWVTSSPNKNIKISKNAKRASFPEAFVLFEGNALSVTRALASAPERFNSASGVIITLPNTAGGVEKFEMFEASNFEKALQLRFPEIRSYVGHGIDDKRALVRLSLDPNGIQAMIFRTDKRNEFMEPYSEDGNTYAVFNSERNKGTLPFVCSTEDIALVKDLTAADRSIQSNGGELLTFRLALSCNAEYTTYFGGTIEGALAAFNATMTRVNGVFEKDFSIHMQIIDRTTEMIFTNPATDPYSSNMNSWNGQLQAKLTATIGEVNYDIGHMFGSTGGGGSAGCIGCVCVNGQKGSGITSPSDNVPMGDNFDIDYVAHEMGHQFGANHTFSNNVEGSGVNVEPGSGSTIMGYAGITNQNIAAHSDDYFVYASIKQVQDNMVSKTCPVRTPLNNASPTVNAGIDYTIPKSTPFILTGSGFDAEDNLLSYCWEQNDTATTQTGSNSQANATKTGGPNWRSYDPVATPTRNFPPFARVAANLLTSVFGSIRTEAVSSVARELNFVLTARENTFGVGQTTTDAMKVTVSGTAGPFLVIAPNTNVALEAGSNQLITWDVAGTDANGINAAFVDIYMSTDSGASYPTLLASKVPNDGAETVTIPNTTGTRNRIMVKGYDHVFYDISNVNFSITTPTPTFSIAFSGTAEEQNKTACQGVELSYTIPYVALEGFSDATTFSASGQPAGAIVTFAPDTVSETANIVVTITNTIDSDAGFYPILITATSGTIIKTVPLYFQLFNAGFSEMVLQSPSLGAISQPLETVLTWEANPNASSYDVQVATDALFTDIVSAATVVGNTYTVTGLSEATNYFWRVLPKNSACSGVFSEASFFETGRIVCDSFASANVPLTISTGSSSTTNSIVTIATSQIVSSVTVTMDLAHTYLGDVTATLISPSGTAVQLFVEPCDGNNNVNATFSDAGVPVICSNNPAISGTVLPAAPLSAFNGQSASGNWILRIRDGYSGDGGTLRNWSLTICETASLSVAQNELSDFVIYPNPNSGNFNVQFTNNSDEAVKIRVNDMRGREIYTKSFQNTGLFNENLQTNNVELGIYLVTIETGNSKQVKKIVIQ